LILVLCVLFIHRHWRNTGRAVEGTLVPPDASAQVSAVREGNTIATVAAEGHGGKFRLPLAAGTYYDHRIRPVSSFPIPWTASS